MERIFGDEQPAGFPASGFGRIQVLDAECGAAKAKYDVAHAHANLLYKEWVQERDRNFCVWCFKPMFLDVLVERLQGIAGSIISDIGRMKEGKP